MSFGWAAWNFGKTTGVEWSPDIFEHRSFRYYGIWAIPLTPKRNKHWKTPLEEFLHKQGFVTAPKAEHPRWRLSKGITWNPFDGFSGEAKYVCFVMGCYSGRSEKWVSWSERHPEAASVLWPEFVDCVRDDEFNKAYSLLLLAENSESTSVERIHEYIQKLHEDG